MSKWIQYRLNFRIVKFNVELIVYRIVYLIVDFSKIDESKIKLLALSIRSDIIVILKNTPEDSADTKLLNFVLDDMYAPTIDHIKVYKEPVTISKNCKTIVQERRKMRMAAGPRKLSNLRHEIRSKGK